MVTLILAHYFHAMWHMSHISRRALSHGGNFFGTLSCNGASCYGYLCFLRCCIDYVWHICCISNPCRNRCIVQKRVVLPGIAPLYWRHMGFNAFASQITVTLPVSSNIVQANSKENNRAWRVKSHYKRQGMWKAFSWHMMTSLNGNIIHITGPLCGKFTGDRWIPLTKTSDAEL